MPVIVLTLEGDNAWPDLADSHEEIIHLPDVTWRLAAREHGMTSGKVSLMLRLDVIRGLAPEGALPVSVVLTETSLAAWIAATCALRARFPEAFADTPLEGNG